MWCMLQGERQQGTNTQARLSLHPPTQPHRIQSNCAHNRPSANSDKEGAFKLHDTRVEAGENISDILVWKIYASLKQMAMHKYFGLSYYKGAGALNRKAFSFFFSPLLGNGPIKSILPKDICFSLWGKWLISLRQWRTQGFYHMLDVT